MNWLNLPIGVVRAPEYAGSDPVERATWLNLLVYCAEQENGGRIARARAWRDRLWQQGCGVALAEVQLACGLWRWEGEDLVVWGYPEDKEEEVRQRRGQAKVNGARGGRRKKDETFVPPPLPVDEPLAEPTLVPVPNQRWLAEEKGREENGKEKEKEGEGAAACGREGHAEPRRQLPEAGTEPGSPPCLDFLERGDSFPGEREPRGKSSGQPQPQPPQPPQQQQGIVFLKEAREVGRMTGRSSAAASRGGEVRPLQEVQGRLGVVWPAAPRAMTGMEMHDLHGSLTVLCELSEEDWTACAAWNVAPLRELGREKRWPRDRAEFVRHAGQAVELIRTWWKQGGRRWHEGKVRQERKAGQAGAAAGGGRAGLAATAGGVVEDRAGEPGDAGALAEFLAERFSV